MEGRIIKHPWNPAIKLMFLEGFLYARTEPGVLTSMVESMWSVAGRSGIKSRSFVSVTVARYKSSHSSVSSSTVQVPVVFLVVMKTESEQGECL